MVGWTFGPVVAAEAEQGVKVLGIGLAVRAQLKQAVDWRGDEKGPEVAIVAGKETSDIARIKSENQALVNGRLQLVRDVRHEQRFVDEVEFEQLVRHARDRE